MLIRNHKGPFPCVNVDTEKRAFIYKRLRKKKFVALSCKEAGLSLAGDSPARLLFSSLSQA